jgi:H+-transporting ATPase
MTRTLLYNQVSISGQALVFVVRTVEWSLMARAGSLTYIAFVLAQVRGSRVEPDRSSGASLNLYLAALHDNMTAASDLLSFLHLQLGSTLISIFGFAGYAPPRNNFGDCIFCTTSDRNTVAFYPEGVVPIALTESAYAASVIGCL